MFQTFFKSIKILGESPRQVPKTKQTNKKQSHKQKFDTLILPKS